MDTNSPASGTYTFPEGSAQQFTFTVSDVAGNTVTLKQTGIGVDLTAPTINGTMSPASPAATGWYNIATGAPTYSYIASDALSGLNGTSPATGNFTFADGAAQTHSFSVTDTAGNTSSVTSAAVNVDRVGPVLSASISTVAATGWYNIASGPAVVTYVTSDATSGVTTPTPYTFGEGANQSVAAITVFDVAGNPSNTTGAFSNIYQDTVAPTLSASINSPGVTGWYNIATGPAVVTYSTSDSTSGVTTPASVTFVDGANQSLAAITVVDVAGNTSVSTGAFSGINQDRVAPTLSITPNGGNFNTSPITFTFQFSELVDHFNACEVSSSTRRIVIRLSSSWPYLNLFLKVA